MKSITLFTFCFLFLTQVNAQQVKPNAEIVFLNNNSYFYQGFKMYGSINSTKPTGTSATSLQLLGESDIFGPRIYGIASFDYNSDGRDGIVAYGRNGTETRVNTIWIFDIIGDHSLNSNFSKQIKLEKTKFPQLADEEYDINGIATGDFDGDGNKDDIVIIARKSVNQAYQNRYNVLITLFYDESIDDFIFGYEYEFTESGYSFLGIAAGNFRNFPGEQNPIDDIAVIRSNGDSNPSLINRILIFPVRKISGTHSIGYPTSLSPLNYDIRSIDTNEAYNATTNAHNFFRPNSIVAGNFNSNDDLDEIAFIGRLSTSSDPNDYYRITILDDFDFSTTTNASYTTKTKLLPYGYRKSLHAISSEDFDDDGVDDILVYGSNGHGNNDKLNTDVDSKMFLYTSSGGYLSFKKMETYNARQVIAATAGRFSRPEYATMEDDGNLYFPLWWYHHVRGDHASPAIRQDFLNQFNEIVSAGIMNGVNLYAHANWVRPTDSNITNYLDNANDLKINLGTEIKKAYRYVDEDHWGEFGTTDYLTQYGDLYIRPRVSYFDSRSEVWGWYIEDEPHLDLISGPNTYPASYSKLQETYNIVKSEDNYNKNISVLDNFFGWYDLGYEYYFPNLDVAMWEDYPNAYGSSSNRFSYRAQTSQLVADLAYKAYKFNNDVTSMKPIIGVLQAEEGDNIVESDLDDYRYMIYTSLIHGSRGLAFYAYYTANSTMKSNVNNAISQLKNLNIPEIISSEPYKGVSTQFENTYSSGSYSYQVTEPYSSLDLDNDPNTPQYFHQINWINYAFRKQSDGYYLLAVNDLNLEFSLSGSKSPVKFTLPFSINKLEVFDFNANTWSSSAKNGNEFYTNFNPYEVKLFRVNGAGAPPYPTAYKIPINSEDELNYEFRLNQNYPNPFNPITTISYALDTQSYVSLKVYNTLGQLVATLVEGVQNKGQHNIRFDASELSSGVYFYKIETNSNEAIKKMILIK